MVMVALFFFVLLESSSVSVSTDSVVVDDVGTDARAGRLFGRVDVSLDQVDGQPLDHEKDVCVSHVYGGHPSVPGSHQCTGKSRRCLTSIDIQ